WLSDDRSHPWRRGLTTVGHGGSNQRQEKRKHREQRDPQTVEERSWLVDKSDVVAALRDLDRSHGNVRAVEGHLAIIQSCDPARVVRVGEQQEAILRRIGFDYELARILAR